MRLPLLDRATPDGLTFALTRRTVAATALLDRSAEHIDVPAPAWEARRMPDRSPGPGEQYRFHVDMKRCIGCKCCVVACNEQNGNPAAINWRRVGEIEGGWFPHATRSYLSMGCNHCLEPTCMAGCPVDAYSKDPVTGIVRHSADACIGCQYCTWNCSYGVPQYNPARGVVGKCDMCHGRLSAGQMPACVSACPEGAIAIEVVNITDWRSAVAAAAESAGVPVADHSLSTTRVTLPELPPNARPRDLTHVTPEHPHWPLVVMTVLTQMSVGAFTTIWLLQLLGASRLGAAAVASFLVAGLALAASTLHLGRPIHAYRALRMWRRSWLSREVLLFGAFSGVAGAYAALLWFGGLGETGGVAGGAAAAPYGRLVTIIGGLTTALGIAGVTASACIYRVPARPAWNTRLTVFTFLLTGTLLGPIAAATLGVGNPRWLALASAAGAGAQFLVLAIGFLRCIASGSPELKGTARLLSTALARLFIARGALLAAGAIVLPLLAAPASVGPDLQVGLWTLALAVAVAAEVVGRYLFFVSVVPTHMAAPYIAMDSEAA